MRTEYWDTVRLDLPSRSLAFAGMPSVGARRSFTYLHMPDSLMGRGAKGQGTGGCQKSIVCFLGKRISLVTNILLF